MESLPAGRDLDSLKQEVEAMGRPFGSTRSGIKRAARQWEPDDKDRGNPGLLPRQRAQLPLSLRVEVIRQICSSEPFSQQIQASAEFPDRNPEHRREWLFAVLFEHVAILPIEPVEHRGQQ